MSNYSKITDFAAKDALAPGNPSKIITGTAHDNEYNAISVAIATKLDAAAPAITGTPTIDGVSLTATANELNTLDGVTCSTAELNRLTGVTSAIQTQLDAKAPTASPTLTGTVTLPVGVTASRALVTGASREIAASAVTATELGYVSGVTSAIQTQLGTKAALSGASFTGAVSSTSTFTGTDFIISSDARLKKDIRRLDDSGALIDALTGYRFTFKASEAKRTGLIAQEIQQVLPELVHPGDDGYLRVSEGGLIAVLIEETKALRARVAMLEAR